MEIFPDFLPLAPKPPHPPPTPPETSANTKLRHLKWQHLRWWKWQHLNISQGAKVKVSENSHPTLVYHPHPSPLHCPPSHPLLPPHHSHGRAAWLPRGAGTISRRPLTMKKVMERGETAKDAIWEKYRWREGWLFGSSLGFTLLLSTSSHRCHQTELEACNPSKSSFFRDV